MGPNYIISRWRLEHVRNRKALNGGRGEGEEDMSRMREEL